MIDPVTMGLVSAGAQAAIGLGQTLFSGRKRKESELESYAQRSPLYKGSKSIDDYYQEAMNRYKENPYQSQQYQVGAQNIQRATAQGLGAMQDRRGGIGAAGRLATAQMSGLQNLGAASEAQRNQRFGQYGQASQLKAGEEYKKFDINKMTPYNRMLALKQMSAQAANERANAGMQMIGGALGNAAQIGMMSAANKKVPITPETPLTTQDQLSQFNAERANTLNTSYIPKTSFAGRNPYVSPASIYVPSAY